MSGCLALALGGQRGLLTPPSPTPTPGPPSDSAAGAPWGSRSSEKLQLDRKFSLVPLLSEGQAEVFATTSWQDA